MAQPVPHVGRVLLIRSPQRLLRREAPARQVFAGGAHRQAHAILAPDQRAHRFPAPQRKVQPQFIGHVAADQPLDRPLLRRIQQPLLIRLAATLAAGQALLALGSEALADVEHPGLAEPDLGSNRRVAHATLAQANHLSPSLLLGRRSQLAHVHVLHI